MTPAEIIARAFSNAPFSSSRSLTSARRAIEALRAAGYDIVGPGEYHERTREAAANVAEERRRYFVVGPDVRTHVSFNATEAATAIRAMKTEAKGE